MSVGQKLAMLKIRSTSISFLSLRNLEAASEEVMQLSGVSAELGVNPEVWS